MNGDALNLNELAAHFSDEDSARKLLERLRWPNGPVCPHCGSLSVYHLEPKPNSKTPVRPGVYKCKDCRKQFTVTVGTIMEDSHVPLHKWLLAFDLLCSSKKGMSAHQLHRMLKVTYKSAWFMAHRIRYAMSQPPLAEKLTGVIEADETYVGGKTHGGKRGRGAPNKVPVFSLVQRDGEVRSFKTKVVTAANLKAIIRENVDTKSTIMTDELSVYTGLDKEFAGHKTVNHGIKQYVNGDAYTNTAEGYFSLLKRGLVGVYHHVSEQHLSLYLNEFDFRYNARKITDGERMVKAVVNAKGKRLTLK